MLFKILLQYLKGYVNIRVEGYFIEKFINKCINEKIFFWNLKREKSTIIYANVGIKEFKDLVKIAKENKCKVKITGKSGIPFIMHKYKKRKIFLVIIILIFIALITLSNFVWNIKIEGLNTINEDEIENLIEEKGIKVGILKSKINTQKIINEIRLERSDIAWIGIELDGTNAIIKIVEKDSNNEVIDDDEYCSIVSTKSAQIVKISASNGIPQVSEGDIVTKGDILIAGWIEGKYTGTRYVHANGEVLAKVWYTETERVALNQTLEEYTGLQENKYKIKINNFEINLFKTLSKFKKYDTIETKNKVKIFSNFYLPIEIIKITNKEIVETAVTYGNEEATQIGIEKASQKIEEQIQNKDNILQKYIEKNESQDYIDVEVTYEVLENIGTKEKIVF